MNGEAINDFISPYIYILPRNGYLLQVVHQNGFYSGKSYREVENKFLVRLNATE